METEDVPRLLTSPERSFFLFGPRGVGKSTWLEKALPDAYTIDLLKSETLYELQRNPSLLEAKISHLPRNSWICIDEIQKIPELLNEVHRLMHRGKYRFAMSGSSARKLRRGGADLLAGRAITCEMESFSFRELKNRFELNTLLQWGALPLVVLDPPHAAETLSNYVHTYLKEEIKEEGIVRKVEPFVRFLEIAGLYNGQQVNLLNTSREASVPRANVDVYFSILVDTLIGHWLPAYRPKAKVREQAHPKFYWFDPGVARGAAGLLSDTVDSVWLGFALETLIFHELRVYNHTNKKNRPIAFYRVGKDSEIDFVVETRKKTLAKEAEVIAIEVKYSKRWNRKWESAARSLKNSKQVHVRRMIGVYLGKDRYRFNEFDVLPVEEFLKELFAGEVF